MHSSITPVRRWSPQFLALLLLVTITLFIALWWYLSAQTTANLDTVPPNSEGHRILYILSDRSPPNSLAPVIRELFTPTETIGWAFVDQFPDNVLIDAVIVDSSVPTEAVNRAWLTKMYDNGIPITLLDRYAPEVAAWVDDPSIAADGFAAQAYTGHFYVTVRRFIDCHPDDAAQIIENIESGSDALIETSRPCSGNAFRATESLETAYGLDSLRHAVESTSTAVQQERSSKR